MYDILKINIMDQKTLYPKYKIDNKSHYKKINELLSITINIANYRKKNVFYFFLITNMHPDNYFICKIGFSENIGKRLKDLKMEYKGYEFHLIGLNEIDQQTSEKQYHYNLRAAYPHLVIRHLKDIDKKVNEIYFYNDVLFSEFNNYNGFIDKKYIYEYLTEKEKTKQNEEKTKQIEIIKELAIETKANAKIALEMIKAINK
jgi:hypothetical protein